MNPGGTVVAPVVVVPAPDLRNDPFANRLGKADLKSGISQSGVVNLKGHGFAIPFGILQGGAFASFAHPAPAYLC